MAEDPAFASLCAEIGVTFVGPSAEAMRKLGDKIGSKLIAEEVGVPVAPWSRGPVPTLEDAKTAADRIGYPLMLKATAGGGGRGIRMVSNADDLTQAYELTRQEAARAFGSGVVFLERLVTGARHVEVQVIADGQGNAWALGVRDCSVQRRNQKIIEESASPVLNARQVADLKASAERLVLAVDYQGAGTVEFLYHPGERLFSFLEVNTRLQVEHPITEITTGVDLVKAQLHVAAGGKLEGDAPAEWGHAVEARLNAEDPDRDFAPSPGRITRLALPSGPGIRVDTGFSEGDTIPADFDSMIAKIIAHGRDRAEALARLRRAMTETTVIIEGGVTNKGFVRMLLDEPAVIDGSADTGWIDRVRAQGGLVSHQHSAIALIAAAIEAYEDEEAVTRQRFLSTAHGGRPQSQHESGRALELKLRDVGYRVQVARTGGHRFRIGISAGGPEHAADVDIERFDEHSGQITVNGVRFKIVTGTHGPIHLVEVDGITHRISRDEGGIVRSPVPALVVATPLQAGDEVEAGAPLIVVESMKMETVLRAPFRSRVRELAVSVGSQVEAGARLLRLEPLGDGDEAAGPAAAAQEVELDLPPEPVDVPAAERAARGLQDLRSLLLGFDIDSADEKRLLAGYLAARAELVAEGQHDLAGEVELLRLFADLSELSRNRPAGEESKSDSAVHSPREYFHTYLQFLDPDRSGLSESFQQRLAHVLSRYGVEDLDRTPELEDAVFRIFLAQQRASADVAVVTTLLRQWVNEAPPDRGGPRHRRPGAGAPDRRHPGPVPGRRRPGARRRVRLVRPAAAAPHPRQRSTRPCASTCATSTRHPDAPDRAERISAMVASAEPLVRLVGQRIGREGADPVPLLEVLTRRYYGNRALSDIRVSKVAGCTFVVADHRTATGNGRVVTTAVDFPALAEAVKAVNELAGDGELVADVYLTWSDGPSDPDEMAARLREVVVAQQPSDRVGRITTTVAGNRGAVMHHHFTFRPSADGFAEERLLRGLHPRIAERMQLERLRDFDLTRLPSPDEEVYLFRAAARQNPSDERLVALGQVRDLTPLRDDEGRLVALARGRGHPGHLPRRDPPGQEAGREAVRHEPDRHLRVAADGPLAGRPEQRGEARAADHGGRGPGGGAVPRQAPGQRHRRARRHRRPDRLRRGLRRAAVRHGAADRAHRAAGRLPPGSAARAQPRHALPVRADRHARRAGRLVHRVRPGRALEAGAGRPAQGAQHRRARRGRRQHAHRRATRRGMTRVVLLGDPTKALGALSEPECARVIAALDLAERMRVPLEWFALSAGARISMSSGTENMDWVAAALKRIVNFTQDGGEINIVVAGINVGAQPYWNAEATMLMHTKGILVMTPDSAMVLTGKQSLDFSGGVSAEDNHGIGGYDRIMGPNGQAQYWAPDIRGAREVLMSHYDHSYVAPGESGPRKTVTSDPVDRDVSSVPARRAGQRLHDGGPDLLRRVQPGPQEAVRHPHRHARAVRPGPPGAGTVGGHGRRGHRRGPGRPPRRPAGVPAGHRVPVRCRVAGSRPPTARTPTPRARCSRGRRRRPPGPSTPPAGTGRWSCWPTCPGSTGRRSRCASCSWSTARRSAARS